MNNARVGSTRITRVSNGSWKQESDLLAVEEPLELRLGYGSNDSRQQRSISVTMRTPGNDFEISIGFLLTEGIIDSVNDINDIHFCESVKEEEKGNVVRVELKPEVLFSTEKLDRHFYTTSSCGVCGKSSIDAVEVSCQVMEDELRIPEELIYTLPDKLSLHQPVFTHTGGLHAAALLDANAEPLFVREDVGRHNALDKAIGAAILKNEEISIAVLSGRISFELIQKAARARIPIIVAVGAPSSLAVQLGKSLDMTLIGFTRDDRFNIYTGKQRIKA